MTALLFALGILGGADVATTCHALHTGRFIEGNALVGTHPSCTRLAVEKVGLVAGTVLVGHELHKTHPKAARWTVSAVVTVNGVTVAWNLAQLGRR